MAGAAHPPERGARHVPRGWTLGQENGAASTRLLAPRDQGTGQARSGQKAGGWPPVLPAAPSRQNREGQLRARVTGTLAGCKGWQVG